MHAESVDSAKMRTLTALAPIHVLYYNIKKTIDKAYNAGDNIAFSVLFAGAEYFLDKAAITAQIKAKQVKVEGLADQTPEKDETAGYNPRNNYIALKEIDIKFAKDNGKILKLPFRPDEVIPPYVHQIYVRQDLSWEIANGIVREESLIDFQKQMTPEDILNDEPEGHQHVHEYDPEADYIACQYVKIPYQFYHSRGTQQQLVAFYANDVIPKRLSKREFAFERKDLCQFIEKGLVRAVRQ